MVRLFHHKLGVKLTCAIKITCSCYKAISHSKIVVNVSSINNPFTTEDVTSKVRKLTKVSNRVAGAKCKYGVLHKPTVWVNKPKVSPAGRLDKVLLVSSFLVALPQVQVALDVREDVVQGQTSHLVCNQVIIYEQQKVVDHSDSR